MMKSLRIPLLLAASASLALAQLTVDFNSPGHFDLNFTSPTAGGLFTESTTGGLSDGGAVVMPEVADNQFWGLDAGFAGNTDHVVSLYLHTAEVMNAGYITIGMMSDVSQSGVVAPSSGDFLGVIVNPDSSEFELRGEGAFNLAGGTFDTVMQPDSWYYIQLTYDWQFNQVYGLQFRAYASDAAGNLGASLISGTTFSTSLESDVADDAEVFSFFGGNNTGNVLTHLDNFSTSALSGITLATSAVPEPGTSVVWFGLTALGFAGCRRRRSA